MNNKNRENSSLLNSKKLGKLIMKKYLKIVSTKCHKKFQITTPSLICLGFLLWINNKILHITKQGICFMDKSIELSKIYTFWENKKSLKMFQVP